MGIFTAIIFLAIGFIAGKFFPWETVQEKLIKEGRHDERLDRAESLCSKGSWQCVSASKVRILGIVNVLLLERISDGVRTKIQAEDGIKPGDMVNLKLRQRDESPGQWVDYGDLIKVILEK